MVHYLSPRLECTSRRTTIMIWTQTTHPTMEIALWRMKHRIPYMCMLATASLSTLNCPQIKARKKSHIIFTFLFFYCRQPVAFFGNYSKAAIAIKCSPIKYQLRSKNGITKASRFALPYRMIFAVATQDSVFVYDTQQSKPLCMLSGMHYASITDISWQVVVCRPVSPKVNKDKLTPNIMFI